jgi:hypothetical protein
MLAGCPPAPAALHTDVMPPNTEPTGKRIERPHEYLVEPGASAPYSRTMSSGFTRVR